MERVTRFGSYGILVQDCKILLTLKRDGPYKGLWDLPGGGIEFGESPEQAMKRELLEESALEIVDMDFSTLATAVGCYGNLEFHHVGIIYKITNWIERSDLKPEEENRLENLNDIDPEHLTPFARQAVIHLFD
jgi:8-oxo-dGTP diphosphatase